MLELVPQAYTRADEAFDCLQTAIVKGDLTPGEKIGEVELCSRFHLTRGPLREALGRLESRGLLVRRPHAGVKVVSVSADELLELYRIRELMEGLAARQAAERMTDAEIAALRATLDTHETMIKQAQGQAYYQAEGDYDFHHRIATGSRNTKLTQMLLGDLYYMVRMYRYRLSTSAGRPHMALGEHRNIVDAIANRDGELAEFLMKRHIHAARKNIEQKIRDGELTI
ncbi:GntR family transcriptional regulator [Marinobacter sp. M3C]|jgi:DNA-binding GntR family transcriptional regulator|uniref:GntR family transcriptional regulator n=1 Tax=unclassified Marinobacter TaxID=83889 RepID=UPI00200C2B19|nr:MULTISPECIES: GntR family transcriptional regulator [unclassified Marinobacter]MCL1479034.1 GntR family transcriptional regulator [Marinobacter sp.]UQG54191.1 GntR family transcriptional regulator [Marinobacter sp. M4C]UQG60400.1 GntR family transcriptional regulator [Marinobacter sp. M3C]UQG62998.1 GntR family transcriptional regulator [Marinobacter sp. M2C]UQG67276.1 GntR family transcriptional regulator [Marinobacter sp. M1C]